MKLELKKYIGAAVIFTSLQAGAYPSSSTDLCFNSLADRALWANKIVKLSDLMSGKLTVIAKQKKLSDLARLHSDGGWETALIPVQFAQYLSDKNSFFKNWNDEDAAPHSNVVGIRGQMASLEGTPRPKELSLEQKAMLALSCGQLAITDALNCENGVSRLLDESSPNKATISLSITYPKVWAEILKSTKYFQGIEAAATSIVSQIESGKIEDNNLLQTIRKEFSKSGFGQMEADEASWKVISMIANGAQNTDERVAELIDNAHLVSSFSMLSKAMGIIDFETFPLKTSSYSFPEEVTGHCQTTKAYHFWMAAFQARELIKQGLSPRAAAMSVLTFAKAYQTQFGVGNTRSAGLGMIFQMPFDHPAVSVIRHDLILNVLGAAYGGGMLKGKHVNIETIFSKVFAARPKVGDLDYEKEAVPLAKDQIKAFQFWEKMFDPNGIFKIVEQEIRNAK